MSTGPQGLLLKQGETTAGQRTFSVHLTLSADGSNAEDLQDAAIALSKAGGAFGAAAGAITQKAAKGGWYDVVLDAADLDTLGDLAYEITGTGVDTLRGHLQVAALDPNAATAIADDGLTAAKLAADAAAEIRTGLATAAQVAAITLAAKTVTLPLGALDANEATPGLSVLDALDATVTVEGTWDGASVTIEVCEDPKAPVPVWTAFDDSGGSNANPLSANGSVVVTGAHNAVRARMANAGAGSDVVATIAIRKPAGA